MLLKHERELVLRLFQQMHQNPDAYWRRASGKSICTHCGLTYSEHPVDMETPTYNDEPVDHRLCDGTIVHL